MNNLGVGDPLHLVWLAGYGEFDNKLKRNKYREKIRRADVIQLTSLISGFTPLSQEFVVREEYSLKKLGILVQGLAALHNIKLDYLIRRLEEVRIKFNRPALIPEIDVDGVAVGPLVAVGGKKQAKNLKSLVQDISTGFGSLDLDTNYLNSVLDPVFNIDDWGDSFVDPRTWRANFAGSSPLKNRKGITEKDGQGRGKVSKSARDNLFSDSEELPSQNDILALLREQAKGLDPFANTILDPVLPPPQDFGGMDDFGDIDQFSEGGRMLLSFDPRNLPQDEVTATPAISVVGIEPVGAPRKYANNMMAIGALANENDDDRDAAQSKRKRKLGPLKFKDDEIMISNSDMFRAIRAWQDEFEKKKTDLLFRGKPEKIQAAEVLHAIGLENKAKELNTEKGMNLIDVAGRKLHGLQLTQVLKSRTPFCGPKKIVENIAETEIDGEELRGQISAVNLNGTPGSVVVGDKSAEISGNALLKSSNAMTSALEVPAKKTGKRSSKTNKTRVEIGEMIQQSPQRPEFDHDQFEGMAATEEHSPLRPNLGESRVKLFSELVPPGPGTSRRLAAHTFVMLLEMQRQRTIVLEQKECYGPIRVMERECVE